MKWLSLLLGIVFVGFTVVQFNDPDAPRWVAIYALCSVVCFGAAFGRCPPWLAASVAGLCLLWSMTLWPALLHMRGDSFTQMHNGNETDEEVRESLGLMIGAVACASVWFWIRSRRPVTSSQRVREVPR